MGKGEFYRQLFVLNGNVFECNSYNKCLNVNNYKAKEHPTYSPRTEDLQQQPFSEAWWPLPGRKGTSFIMGRIRYSSVTEHFILFFFFFFALSDFNCGIIGTLLS